MNDEWGPWIEHDGKGCPCVGKWVESVQRDGLTEQHVAHGLGWKGFAGNPLLDRWVHKPKSVDIVRYRVRKPRALIELIDMVENLRAPVGPKVDA